jgi:prepilin-type N-terminal cleavage/methylation domain-containing protein
MIGRFARSYQQGFTMLELLMAISISLLVLAMGTGLVLQGLPVEKRLASEMAKLELAARKAAMQSSFQQRDVFLTVRNHSFVGPDGEVVFDEGEVSISRPGKSAPFKAPPTNGYLWKFGANGLCEPLRIKFTLPEGEMELDFDPLTGETRTRQLMLFES